MPEELEMVKQHPGFIRTEDDGRAVVLKNADQPSGEMKHMVSSVAKSMNKAGGVRMEEQEQADRMSFEDEEQAEAEAFYQTTPAASGSPRKPGRGRTGPSTAGMWNPATTGGVAGPSIQAKQVPMDKASARQLQAETQRAGKKMIGFDPDFQPKTGLPGERWAAGQAAAKTQVDAAGAGGDDLGGLTEDELYSAPAAGAGPLSLEQEMDRMGLGKVQVSGGGMVKSSETVSTQKGADIGSEIAQFEEGFEEKAEALGTKSELLGKLAAEKAQIQHQARVNLEAEQIETKERHEEQQAEIRSRMGEVQKVTDALMNAEIDAGRLWSSKGAASKMSGILSVMMGAASQSISGGPNTGLNMMNKAIENDIAAQKATFATRAKGVAEARGMLTLARQMSDDDLEADEKFRLWTKESAIMRLEELGNLSKSEQASSNAQMAVGQLKMDTARHKAALQQMAQDKVTNAVSFKRVPPKIVDLRKQYADSQGAVDFIKAGKEERDRYYPAAGGYATRKEDAIRLTKADEERDRVLLAAKAYQKALLNTTLVEGKLPTLKLKALEGYRSALQVAVKKRSGFGANFTENEEKIQNHMLGTEPMEFVKAVQGGKDVSLKILIRETEKGGRHEAMKAGLQPAYNLPDSQKRAVTYHIFRGQEGTGGGADQKLDIQEGSPGG